VCIVCIERVCWIFVVKMFAVFSSLTIHKWVLKQRFGSFVVGQAVGGKCSKADEHVFHISTFSSKSKDGDGYR
jgi:hypothetical protein